MYKKDTLLGPKNVVGSIFLVFVTNKGDMIFI